MMSDSGSGTIAALASNGTGTNFTTVALAAGQVGLRQMLMTPDDYLLDSLGIPGRLLLLSITGSGQGGGTLGALVALDSSGAVVAHLKTGGILEKFDPRGMVFTADGQILISDSSDPILIASAKDFILGPAAQSLTELSPAHLWVGLRNSDDQGTQFDLKVELLRNATPVASGIKRCITGVTRDPGRAKEVIVSFESFAPVVVTAGDRLSLRVSTRIGTNANEKETKCYGPGGSHNSAVGLRLYYDSTRWASHFDATIAPNPSENLFLHSNGGPCGSWESGGVTKRFLDSTASGSANVKCKDSGGVNFAAGNRFSVVGTWSLAPRP